MITKRRSIVAGLLFLTAGLAGCGRVFDDSPPRPCPPVFVAKQAAFLTQFKPGSVGDITDVVFRNRITDFRGECSYNRKNTELKLTLSVIFDMFRGPANQDRRAEFAYFVAIPKFYPNPAGKQIFGVAANFDENQTRRRAVDTVEMTVPLDPKVRLQDYAVYIGFQLTAAQLEDNLRKTRGR